MLLTIRWMQIKHLQGAVSNPNTLTFSIPKSSSKEFQLALLAQVLATYN